MRMPHHHVQALEIAQRTRAAGQGVGAGLHEGRAQQQVFGRVAAQAQFGEKHQPRALRVCTLGRFDDSLRVAGDVAHRHVDLREGHLHRGLG